MGKGPEKVSGGGPRILIVEDETIVALDIENILVSCGYRTIGRVARGEDAVAEAAKSRPDLILMDVRLAGEMTGIEAAEQIRSEFGIPSLFLTSFSDREILRQAKKSDPLGYILKPFEERELEAGIEIALHRWEVESGLRRALEKDEDAGALQPPPLSAKTLGRLEISLKGKTVARLEDFSQAQREILGLLFCTPALRMSRRNIQLTLWPDSSSERARSSFDSLLLRLRKTLAERIHPLPVGDYLQLSKGILCLENCQVDVAEFARLHEEARAAIKSDRTRTAETLLAAAIGSYQGPFMAGTCGNDACFEFAAKLEGWMAACTTDLTALLEKEGRLEDAIEVVTRTVQSDPTNDGLIRDLCRLLRKSADPTRMRKVLDRYEEALRKAEFPESEIAAILKSL